MSADNGIYIIQFNDQCRVIHAQAMDSLNWTFINFSTTDKVVPTRLISKVGSADPMNLNDARKYAFELEEAILNSEMPIIEYGICTIKINNTWGEVLEEAKRLAPLEIESIKREYKDQRFANDVKLLESILNM